MIAKARAMFAMFLTVGTGLALVIGCTTPGALRAPRPIVQGAEPNTDSSSTDTADSAPANPTDLSNHNDLPNTPLSPIGPNGNVNSTLGMGNQFTETNPLSEQSNAHRTEPVPAASKSHTGSGLNAAAIPDLATATNLATRDSRYALKRVFSRRIDVYAHPSRRAQVVGFLKRGAQVQARIDGAWTALRGSGYIESRHLQPQPTRHRATAKRPVRGKPTVSQPVAKVRRFHAPKRAALPERNSRR